MRAALFLFFSLLSLAAPASAHRLAPSYLSLEVSADGKVDVLWKTAQVVARGAKIDPVLPEVCQHLGEAEVRAEGTAWVTRIRMDCGSEGLIGQRISVTGLEESGTDALVRIAFADGREVRTILTKTAPTMQVPEKESRWRVFSDYVRLGVGHLLGGPDHLLFVLGLMLLMPTSRKLLAAVTAFTLGHSLTLALAALGILGVPQGLVELTIAATLVVLARETLLPHPEASALVRRPWIAPAAFGLVHGLGFAGALAELGLPGHAIPLALFAFNVGIEIGQIGVVLAGWWAVRALARRQTSLPRWLAEAPATVIGTLGVFWCLQRATTWLLP
ncbi:MAG: HupE/UreJ family protein [Deltaproteobacteria bacterium]|nr:HupE/UreJ family protein [Deltaproteobacteria bacterium]